MSDDPPAKKPVSTRLPKDDYQELQEYCRDRGVSQSDAIRRFIRDGLKDSANITVYGIDPAARLSGGGAIVGFTIATILFEVIL